MNVINGTLWAVYGFALSDYLIAAPNALGALFCGLGQLITTPYSFWMLFLCAEKHFKPIDCFKASMSHAKGRMLDIWLFIIIVGLTLSLITVFTCGLGFFVIYPMFFIAIARYYEIERDNILEAAKKEGLNSLQGASLESS